MLVARFNGLASGVALPRRRDERLPDGLREGMKVRLSCLRSMCSTETERGGEILTVWPASGLVKRRRAWAAGKPWSRSSGEAVVE